MTTTAEGMRGDALTNAFKDAIAGRPDRLYVLLSNASGLPGTRVNMVLAQAFAVDCVGLGKASDRLVIEMCNLTAERAPGDSGGEFLPVCGVLALGARSAHDPNPALRKKALLILHALSEDFRFRVREVVPVSLSRIGAVMGDTLVHELASWTDGFFQGAAALQAMAQPNFLPVIDDVDALLTRLDEGYALARNAPRSASRYPGFKALVDALATAPAAFATRFGVPVFDRVVTYSNTQIKELRAAVEAFVRSPKLTSRYADETKRVQRALDASVPPPRDPTLAVKGMRGRGKKRDRR